MRRIIPILQLHTDRQTKNFPALYLNTGKQEIGGYLSLQSVDVYGGEEVFWRKGGNDYDNNSQLHSIPLPDITLLFIQHCRPMNTHPPGTLY